MRAPRIPEPGGDGIQGAGRVGDARCAVEVRWPAKALVWMCTPDADEYLGQEISLREEGIRRRVGLIR